LDLTYLILHWGKVSFNFENQMNEILAVDVSIQISVHTQPQLLVVMAVVCKEAGKPCQD